jgi:Xaa-Pro aminopeptidase
MDVHDCGEYRQAAPAAIAAAGQAQERPWRTLEPGMVLTIEPGIYVRPAPGVPEAYWHIGIRIEDDVLITPTGHHILSAAAPKTVAEIEAMMQAPQ